MKTFFGSSVLEHKGVGVLRGEFESAMPNISPWCNGSTSGFGPLSRGPNPLGEATGS